jgi:hypothetical protein
MPVENASLHPSSARRQRIEPGIRSDRYGYEAQVKVSGKILSKRFPPDTPLDGIRYWRTSAQADMRCNAVFAAQSKRSTQILPKSLDGWCYVYFIRSRDTVKIGRATDPAARLKELQTGHPHTLELIVAVPAHALLERALHERFVRQRLAGEWFQVDADIVEFVGRLKAGENPVALLW